MVTRAQVGTVKPNPRFRGHTSHISPLPKSPSIALSDPNWRDDMHDEYNALIKNSTWVLVLKPSNVNVIGVDCEDTFSPFVKPATIRTVLSLALSRNWPIHQLDVKNDFLNDDLSETIYMHLVLGFNGSRDMLYELDFLRVDVTRHYLYISMLLRLGHTLIILYYQLLCNLLRELHTPLLSTTLVYCDNVSAIYMTVNPVQHQRTKHIEIDIHFVSDMVTRGQVRVLHVTSRYQYADIFTNGLSSALFEEFRASLSVRSSPAQTAGEC
ncbi:ribonuclease H-like domain-containing protein [Tanacetum coccineum]